MEMVYTKGYYTIISFYTLYTLTVQSLAFAEKDTNKKCEKGITEKFQSIAILKMSMDCRGFREEDVWKKFILRPSQPSKLTVPILSFTEFLFPPKIYLHAIQYMHVNP